MIASLMAAGAILTAFGDSRNPDDLSFTRSEGSEQIDETLKIMTANVHSWNGSSGSNYETFEQVVKENNPDIICMQEVLADNGNLKRLNKLGYNVYFHATYHHPINKRYGNAVASKSEIHDISTISLPASKRFNPRNAINFSVDTVNGLLRVTNTHLDTNGRRSDAQLRYMDDKLMPNLDFGCGDFNKSLEDMQSGPLGSMLGGRSAYAVYKTYPSINPTRQIDHILTNCGAQLRPALTPFIDSDHRAVIKEYDITDCASLS